MKIQTKITADYVRSYVSTFTDKEGNKKETPMAEFLQGDDSEKIKVKMKDNQQLEKYKTYEMDIEISTYDFNGVHGLSIREL